MRSCQSGFDSEVKARAVRLVAEHKAESGSVTRSCEAVGRRLGISKETLRGWYRQAQVDAGERDGVSSEERAEIKRLKAENRRLREDVEILRAATSFFAGELCATRRCVCRGVVRDRPRWVVAAA
jgi:transposase